MSGPIGCRLGGPDGRNGRTGNMLFRAASTLGLARRYGTDPRFENGWPYRPFFSMPDEWFIPLDELDGLVQAHELPDLNHVPETYRHYLQDVSLWWDHRAEVRSVLQPSALAMESVNTAVLRLGPMPEPTLAIHVRRGDNVTNEAGTINALPEDYYRDAVLFRRRSVVPAFDARSILVVTDDADWCERHLVPLLLSFVADVRVLRGKPRAKEADPEYLTEAPLDWVDLFVLAGCSDVLSRPHQIAISNSTFAYFAAVIGGWDNPIRPSYWCGEQLTVDQSIDVSLLWPDTWTAVVAVTDPNPGRSLV